MTLRHPDPAELARFARGNLASPDNRRIVRDLLAAWRAGRSEIEPVCSGGGGPVAGEVPAPTGLEPAPGLAGLLERARQLARDRERVPELRSRLDAVSRERRRSVLRSDPAFRSWAFCERLIEECHGLTDSDVTRAEDLADFAVAVAEGLDLREHGEPLINDLKARAWCAVGEVLGCFPISGARTRPSRSRRASSERGRETPWRRRASWSSRRRYGATSSACAKLTGSWTR